MSGIAVIYAGEKVSYPLHVFYRDDANIKHLYWNSGGSHTDNWAGPSSPKHPTPAAGGPTAMFTDPGAMHVFYSDKEGNIYHLYDAPMFGRQCETWSGAHDAHITPCTIADQANPVAVYASAWNKRLHVFFRNDTGDIVETGKDPELGYGQYTWAGPNSDISSETTTAVGDPVTLHVPTPHADFNAQYMIFYRDSKGNIVHVAPVEGTGIGVEAQAWNTTPDAASDPVAYCYDNGQRSVFYRNSNGDIVELFKKEGAKLTDKALITVVTRSATDPNAAAAVGNPGFAYDRDKKTQNIFYRDGSGNIHRVWWTYGKSTGFTWKVISGPTAPKTNSDNTSIGESINYQAIGDPVASYTPDDKCLHVFYTASTKTLVHIKLDSSDNIFAECW